MKKIFYNKQILLLWLLMSGLIGTSQTPQSSNPTINSTIKAVKPVLSPVNTSTTTTTSTPAEQPASARITDGKEPAELVGYISWVDPDTQKKHLLKGQNNSTGEWKILFHIGSFLSVKFINVTTREIFPVALSAGPYYTAIDSAGNDLGNPNTRVAWNPNQLPAGLKYRVLFVFDLGYNGLPVPYEATDRTIRYNPTIWKFYDIEVQTTLNNATNPTPGYNIPMEDFPQRPVQVKKRTTKFTDLPEF